MATAMPHKQVLEQEQAVAKTFTGTQFVGYIAGDLKLLRNGGMSVTFHVPFEFKHLVFSLADSISIPLSIDVRVWKPYENRVEQEKDE